MVIFSTPSSVTERSQCCSFLSSWFRQRVKNFKDTLEKKKFSVKENKVIILLIIFMGRR